MTRLLVLRNLVVALGYVALFGVLVVFPGRLLPGVGRADSVMGQLVPGVVVWACSILLPAFLVGALAGRLGSLGGGLPGWLGLGVLIGAGPVMLSFLVVKAYPHLPGVGWQTYALSLGIVACCVCGGALGRRLRRRQVDRGAGGETLPAGEV